MLLQWFLLDFLQRSLHHHFWFFHQHRILLILFLLIFILILVAGSCWTIKFICNNLWLLLDYHRFLLFLFNKLNRRCLLLSSSIFIILLVCCDFHISTVLQFLMNHMLQIVAPILVISRLQATGESLENFWSFQCLLWVVPLILLLLSLEIGRVLNIGTILILTFWGRRWLLNFIITAAEEKSRHGRSALVFGASYIAILLAKLLFTFLKVECLICWPL